MSRTFLSQRAKKKKTRKSRRSLCPFHTHVAGVTVVVAAVIAIFLFSVHFLYFICSSSLIEFTYTFHFSVEQLYDLDCAWRTQNNIQKDKTIEKKSSCRSVLFSFFPFFEHFISSKLFCCLLSKIISKHSKNVRF